MQHFSFILHAQGHTEGGFQGFPETPLDCTHQLKHSEIEAKGLQNLESVMEQDTFYTFTLVK